MIYVKVENGIVTKKVDTTNDHFVFFYRKLFKTFSLWLRVDNLDPIPNLGWKYDKDTGFTET